jgi:biopolymer transport protein ExbD
MPKIKMPKAAPSIDMTPMVDLAFLLVTFFMLSANFRETEPVQVDTPSSVAEVIIPKNIIMVTVDKGGRVFFNVSGAETRAEVLAQMEEKYKVNVGPEGRENFIKMTSFGCSMAELPGYLKMSTEERKRFDTKGIPADTTAGGRNELKDWINFSNKSAMSYGKLNYEEALMRDAAASADDFKPKFILKVDSKAVYVHAKNVIDIFRDLNLSNLNFVTNLEENPNAPAGGAANTNRQ